MPLKPDFAPYLMLALTVVSIPSMHTLGFMAAMPQGIRQFVDFRFSVGLVSSMAIVAALSAFAAGYLPKILVGVYIYVHGASIEAEYYQRGYRRVYVPATGFGPRARKLRSIADFRAHFEQSANFDRNNARLSNLKNRKINSRFPVAFYAKNNAIFFSILFFVFFSFGYVGVWRAFSFLLVALAAFLGIFFFNYSSSGHIFRLERYWWHPKERTTEQTPFFLDIDLVATLLAAAAVSSFMLGYLRLGYVVSSPSFVVSDSGSSNFSIVGPSSDGLIVFSNTNSYYRFVPYDDLGAILFK